MRYKDIFKKWWFWTFLVLHLILSLSVNLVFLTDSALFNIILFAGTFTGSFVFVWIVVSIIYGISKLFKKKR